MAKELTQNEITSRELERLVAKIEQKDLREQIQQAIAKLELHKSYGLRFERHIPEIITHDNKPIPLGGKYFPWLKKIDQVQGAKPKGPEHILIESDNYVALKYLQYTHQGKIDVIYIDPPYNTGAKDWKYNNNYVDGEDVFRHSKWLSFMEKRLKLAKRLLNPDGVLICSIDHYELFPLGMLLEEIFKGWEVTQTVVVNNPSGRYNQPFSTCHEYHLIVHRPNKKSKPIFLSETELGKKFPKKDNSGRYKLRSLIRNSNTAGLRKQRPLMWFPIWVDKEGKNISIEKKSEEQTPLFPIDSKGIERTWYWNKTGVETKLNDIIAIKSKGLIKLYFKEREKTGVSPKTVWMGPEHNYTTQGTGTLKDLLPSTTFNFPKSVETVKFAIDRFLPRNGTCLDFFAGSGTTFQAVAELNEADGGTRQCILVTNNESNICREVTWERVKRVTTGTHAYAECTKKYDGNPRAHATFYTVEIYSENEIEKISRGWKQNMEGYLPLLSTKLNLPHKWTRIPDTKGFYQKEAAIVDVTELDYETQQFLKKSGAKTLAIISDDKEEFHLAAARCKKTTKIKEYIFLPREYTNYFESFHTKE